MSLRLVPPPAAVDVVVPVYNEERDLEPSVRRLDATRFPSTAPKTGASHDLALPAIRPRRRELDAAARRRLGVLGLLGLTAALYLWGLGRSGYANDFYSAAVQAGTESWKAFLFGSFDASSYITVDKPPASLWVMELSGRLFGFSTWSMLVPQALEGVAAVWLLYATVRRWFSHRAALLSGLILAVTPVAALMFRYNNPDALLVLLTVLAAYMLVRALERASTRWLALAGAALGLAFLAKMFQAFLVLPAFAAVYVLAAPVPLRRRLWQLAVAGAALAASAGWWVAVVALTPAADRPYVGGSTNNSILDLIWGYNGLGRIDGGSRAGPGGGFSGATGPARLFNSLLGGQISWLLPAALLAIAAGLWASRRAPRTDRTRAALLLFGGWLVVSGLVYSYASGIVHTYYTNTLAPPIAALVGAGAVLLWDARRRLAPRLALAGLLAVTAWWSFALLDRTPAWHPWLRWTVLVGGAAVALGVAFGGRLSRPAAAGLAAAGLVAGLGGPLAYTLDTVASAQSGGVVSAGPSTGQGGPPPGFGENGPPTGFGGGNAAPGQVPPRGGLGRVGPGVEATTTPTALVTLLRTSAARYEWVAATGSAQSAAPLELASGEPVMALGGFTGSDPAMTLVRFERLVAAGKIHYFAAGGGRGGPGGRAARSEIESWVAAHFATVTAGGTTLYDLTRRTS